MRNVEQGSGEEKGLVEKVKEKNALAWASAEVASIIRSQGSI